MIAMKILIVYTEMTETEQAREGIDAMMRLLADSELETEIVRLSSEHFEPCVVCGKCYKKYSLDDIFCSVSHISSPHGASRFP